MNAEQVLLPSVFFLLGTLSGFTAYHLRSARRRGRVESATLVRIATLLAYGWLTLSVLLFAWAAARLAS